MVDFRDVAGALASGFNQMRLRPDPGLDARLQTIQQQRTANRAKNKTVEYLRGLGTDMANQLASMVESGALTGQQAYAQILQLQSEERAFGRQKELAEYEASLKVPKVTAAEQKIQRLRETGLDRPTAIAIADGRFVVSKDPITKEVTLIDKATGNVIGKDLPEEVVKEASADTLEEDGLFQDTDVSKGLGLGGWMRSAVNVVTDAIGAGQKFPEAGKVEASLNNLQTRTILMAGVDVQGKPSDFTREEIKRNLTISPSEISTGPKRAYQKANAMVQLLEQTYGAMSIASQGGGGASVQQVSDARENINSLETLLKDYRSLRDALELKGAATGQTASGSTSGTANVSSEDFGLIQKYKKVPYYVQNMTPGPD